MIHVIGHAGHGQENEEILISIVICAVKAITPQKKMGKKLSICSYQRSHFFNLKNSWNYIECSRCHKFRRGH